jgi:hypothetical protein
MTTPLKLLVPICLLFTAPGCSLLMQEPAAQPPGAMPHNVTTPASNWERYQRLKGSSAIDQRAKQYEQDGLAPEYARAAAEIEYAKSGR